MTVIITNQNVSVNVRAKIKMRAKNSFPSQALSKMSTISRNYAKRYFDGGGFL
jgi:hypothetical protein